MSNPSHGVNAYAKQIALHLYQYPIAVKWGGSTSLELSSPSPPPFTPDKKEYGLHFAADASPGDETRGITGGVGMLAGGALVTISSRQHLATSSITGPMIRRQKSSRQVGLCGSALERAPVPRKTSRIRRSRSRRLKRPLAPARRSAAVCGGLGFAR